jgi:hypothetical protein
MDLRGAEASMSVRRQESAVDGDELLRELLATSVVARQEAALLLWHRLYGWPALRAIDCDWPMLKAIP